MTALKTVIDSGILLGSVQFCHKCISRSFIRANLLKFGVQKVPSEFPNILKLRRKQRYVEMSTIVCHVLELKIRMRALFEIT